MSVYSAKKTNNMRYTAFKINILRGKTKCKRKSQPVRSI